MLQKKRKSKMMEAISITTSIPKNSELSLRNHNKRPNQLHNAVILNSNLDIKKTPASKEYSLALPAPQNFTHSAAVI